MSTETTAVVLTPGSKVGGFYTDTEGHYWSAFAGGSPFACDGCDSTVDHGYCRSVLCGPGPRVRLCVCCVQIQGA